MYEKLGRRNSYENNKIIMARKGFSVVATMFVVLVFIWHCI